MLLLIGIALWSMVSHQVDMQALVEKQNLQEAQFGIALLESQAEKIAKLSPADIEPYLEANLTALQNGDEDQAILIVDSDRHVILYTGSSHDPAKLGSHPGVEEAFAGAVGTISEPFPDSVHLISYGPIESLDWVFVIEEFWISSRFARLNLTLLVPLLLIPLLFIFFLFMWGSNRWVIKPLSVLNSYAKKVGDGNYDERIPYLAGIKEVDELQIELDQMVQTLRESRNSLRRYASAIQTSQEEERKRLAQELHDDTIQSLVHLDQKVQLLDLSADDAAVLREQIKLISANLRTMIQDLRPSYLDELGLIPALEMLAQQVGFGREDLIITFESTGKLDKLDPDDALAFYRIAQEGVNNSLKHAQATQIDIAIESSNDEMVLAIIDDGVGIAEKILKERERYFGLRGMEERASSIGGKFNISADDQGTRIELSKSREIRSF